MTSENKGNTQVQYINENEEDEDVSETEVIYIDKHDLNLKNKRDSEQNDVTLVVPEIKIQNMNGNGKHDETVNSQIGGRTFRATARASKVYPSFNKKKDFDSESVTEESLTIWQVRLRKNFLLIFDLSRLKRNQYVFRLKFFNLILN